MALPSGRLPGSKFLAGDQKARRRLSSLDRSNETPAVGQRATRPPIRSKMCSALSPVSHELPIETRAGKFASDRLKSLHLALTGKRRLAESSLVVGAQLRK
jgi:hypothetical protein